MTRFMGHRLKDRVNSGGRPRVIRADEPINFVMRDESIPHAEDHNAHVERVLAASKGGYPVLRT